MTRISCAVGMRNAKLWNHLNSFISSLVRYKRLFTYMVGTLIALPKWSLHVMYFFLNSFHFIFLPGVV